MDLASNIAGMLGVILLAMPAFYAAKYGRLIHRLSTLEPVANDNASRKAHAEALGRLKDHQGNWTPRLSFCLKFGTLSAVLAQLLGLLEALFAA